LRPRFSEDPLTPTKAVVIGHRQASLPALAIIGAVGLAGDLLFGRAALVPSLLVGIAPGWLWWSYAVPRWRDWVETQGLDEAAIYSTAVNYGLVFPKGFLLESTEFRRRDGTRGWRTGPPT
jgi:hypothetical protein